MISTHVKQPSTRRSAHAYNHYRVMTGLSLLEKAPELNPTRLPALFLPDTGWDSDPAPPL